MADPTVVLLPVWGVGHFMPMIEAGKRMAQCSSRALSLTVLLMPVPAAQAASDIAGHVRREEASDSIDIRFHHLPHVRLPTDHTGIEEFISRIVQLHVPHIRAAISGLTCPVAALLVDIFCTPALDASRELAVPAYVYFTSSAVMLALLLRSQTLHEEVEVEFEEMEGVVDVPGLPPVPPSFLPGTMLDKKTTTYTWFVYTGRRYMQADGIIVNTAAELEPGVLAAIADGRCTRGVPAPTVYPIGPAISISPPSEQPHECVRWLDSQPPASVLFLCFGSKGLLSTSQVHEIAHGLERSGHRFLWVLHGLPVDTTHGARDPTDANLAEALPEGFLEKTKDKGMVWPKRAPQKEILAHASVGGFVTHCGWNSILESLWCGVPMLPWPLDADQHFNAFTLVHDMGVGRVAVTLEVVRKQGNYVEAAELERAPPLIEPAEDFASAPEGNVHDVSEGDDVPSLLARISLLEENITELQRSVAAEEAAAQRAAASDGFMLSELQKASEQLLFALFDEAEENKRVGERVEALRKLIELSDVVTLWSDPAKREAVTLLQDRIRQVEDLVERCRGALALLHDAMFPLNPLPVGLAALLETFHYGKDVSGFVRAQIVAGAELALVFVRSHYPKVDFAAVANGPPVGKRNVTMMQVHDDAIQDSAHRIADLLIKRSDETKEQPGGSQDDKKGKKKGPKKGSKKGGRLEILDFM